MQHCTSMTRMEHERIRLTIVVERRDAVALDRVRLKKLEAGTERSEVSLSALIRAAIRRQYKTAYAA